MVGWIGLGLGAVALALAGANIRTSVRLWRSTAYECSQKIAQTALMWLVPGAFVIVNHLVLDAMGKPQGARDKDATVDSQPESTEFSNYADAWHGDDGGHGHH